MSSTKEEKQAAFLAMLKEAGSPDTTCLAAPLEPSVLLNELAMALYAGVTQDGQTWEQLAEEWAELPQWQHSEYRDMARAAVAFIAACTGIPIQLEDPP